MGRDPFPFDLLHWNSDATRMPAAMHSSTAQQYLKNLLARARRITFLACQSTSTR